MKPTMYSLAVAALVGGMVGCVYAASAGHINKAQPLQGAASTTTVIKTGSGSLPAGIPVSALSPGLLASGMITPGMAIPQYARSFTGLTGYSSFSDLGDLSGYIRDQWENRDGITVRGGYTIARYDGTLIVVEYTSDPVSGFRVVVHRTGFPDWYPDSLLVGSPLPGGYLPPFYSDLGFDYGSYYGYDDIDYDYDLDLGLDFLPSYYDGYDYDYYAPSYADSYEYDYDLDFFKKRRR